MPPGRITVACGVRDLRFALAVLLGLSMLANLVLSHGLATRERMTVLVPAVSGPVWTVGESWAGRRYWYIRIEYRLTVKNVATRIVPIYRAM